MKSTDPSGLVIEEKSLRSKSLYYSRDNPVQQRKLDSRYNFSPTTNSCKTAAIITSYLADGKTLLTLEIIDKIVLKEDGSIRNTSIAKDGSPKLQDEISQNTARALGRTKYNKFGTIPESVDSTKPSILKRTNLTGSHYVYSDDKGVLDSLDPYRIPSSPYYDASQISITEADISDVQADAHEREKLEAEREELRREAALSREAVSSVDTTSSTESSTTSNTEGNDSVICHELFNQGLMNVDIHKADEAFGSFMKKNLPIILKGYQLWAKPVVMKMQSSKRFTNIVNSLAKPWTLEMAYWMGAKDSGNIFGFFIMIIGLPLCGLIGVFYNYFGFVIFGLVILFLLFTRSRIIKVHSMGGEK